MAGPNVQFGFSRSATRLDEYLEWVRVADEAGADIIGFGDGQDLWVDPYVTLTLTAANTSRARVGPTVTNPVTRHPAVTAGAIASLQQFSGGRAFLGIGTGLSALRNIGEKSATVAELEEYIRAVQGLTSGKTVEYRGESLRMNWDPPRVPVFVGGRGPRVLHMAGRVADGVIVGGGVTSGDTVRKLLGHIRAGADAAGRDMSELEIWWLTRVVLAPSEAEGTDMMRDYLAGFAAHGYQNPRTLAEAPTDVQEKIHMMERGYRWDEHLAHKPGDSGISFNAALLEEQGIKEWLAHRFVITGPPEHCVKGLRELVEAGAVNFIIPQVLPNPKGSTKALGEQVFPAFR
jgi:5,10-methylenetetrahydromethanopterin reductase